MFNCNFCKRDFEILYNLSKNRTIYFCSKSCATKNQMNSLSKEQIKNKILEVIKEQNRYLTLVEISKFAKISNKTITKNKISIVSLNNELGFKKPKSKFEEDTFNVLQMVFHNYQIIREKSFDDLKSPKNFPLFFDFYIPELNLLIEADGNQHYNEKNPNFSSYVKDCDIIKDNYCENNNIQLIRIQYKKDVTIEYIKSLLYYNEICKDIRDSCENRKK